MPTIAEFAELRQALEQANQAVSVIALPQPQLTPAETEAQIAELRVQAMDHSLGEQARLVALQQLRGLGEDARNGEVALALIDMAMRSEDPAVRADVWRQMSGSGDPALVQPLLQCLSSDPNEEVRHEAAETLGDFTDVPGVRAALEYAMNSDTSPLVQREARAALGIR